MNTTKEVAMSDNTDAALQELLEFEVIEQKADDESTAKSYGCGGSCS